MCSPSLNLMAVKRRVGRQTHLSGMVGCSQGYRSMKQGQLTLFRDMKHPTQSCIVLMIKTIPYYLAIIKVLAPMT